MDTKEHSRILDPDLFHVAWIAPLEIEAQAALAVLDQRYHGRFPMDRGDEYLFKAGKICGHEVIIATLPDGDPYGTTSSAALASHIKKIFHNLRFCLLVGIAAGLPSATADIRLGDVLVAVPDGNTPAVVDYELGKMKADGKFELLRQGHVLASIDRKIGGAIRSLRLDGLDGIQRFLQHYQQMSTSPSSGGIFADPGQENDRLFHVDQNGSKTLLCRQVRPSNHRTRVWHGPIGSGNKLSKDAKTRDSLRDDYNVRGLEMEAAGIMNILPVGVVRGVCDYGDEQKNDDWHHYAAAMAASYAKTVLGELAPQEPVSPPPRAMSILSFTGPDFTSDISACLRSLSFPELNDRLANIEEPAPHTTLWVIQDSRFCAWRERAYIDGNPGILWFKGKPGSGKSTIMKSLTGLLAKEHIVASFFFSSSGSLLQQTPFGMYRSLVYQLARDVPAIRDSLADLWKEKSEAQARSSDGLQWHENELKSFLRKSLRIPSTPRIMLFIEALDECNTVRLSEAGANEDQARGAAFFLQDILADANTSGVALDVCTSSGSSFQFGASRHWEIKVDQHNEHDLELYVDCRLKRHLEMPDNEQSKLRRGIVKKASRIFLWAKLAVDRLLADYDGGRSLKYMMHQLDALPAQLLGIYLDILNKPELPEREKATTTRFFQWVLLGTRLFQLREWHVILGLIQCERFRSLQEWSESVDYPTNQSQLENQIRRISRGLVEVSSGPEPDVSDEDSVKAGPGSMLSTCGETRTVQVIHTSVRDFFLGTRPRNRDPTLDYWQKALADGHSTIIQGCLDFINTAELDSLVTARKLARARWNGSRGGSAVSSFHSAASHTSRGSSTGRSQSIRRRDSSVDVDMEHMEDSEPSRPESPFRYEESQNKRKNQRKPYRLWKPRKRQKQEIPSPQSSSNSPSGDEASGKDCTQDIREATNKDRRGSIKFAASSPIVISGGSSIKSQVLEQGDITVLLDYASVDIFEHVRVAQMQPSRTDWLEEQLGNIWPRIALLRDDLNYHVSLHQYCLEIGLEPFCHAIPQHRSQR